MADVNNCDEIMREKMSFAYRHIFPYHLFQKGDSVLIYGAGDIGREFYQQAKRYDYVDIVGIVDKNAARITSDVFTVESLDAIDKYEYDVLLIAIHDEDVANSVRDDLLELGVDASKIMWDGHHYYRDEFYKFYFSMLCNLPEMGCSVSFGGNVGSRGCYSDKARISYLKFLEKIYQKTRNDFVEFCPKPFRRQDGDSKVIAYYLPQFHKMDVNDRYHGMGFTEWTNTSRMIPLYENHWQPHIPYDVGYYDLDNPEAMKRQIFLAKHYGIYGFCFYWYWFSGVKAMEKPAQMLLEHKDMDMPFCFCWATENWTSKWDGENHDIIYEQKLSPGDDEAFMRDLLPYFKDRRYIRIKGKPILIIYRVGFCSQKELKQFISNIRIIAEKQGVGGLYIMISTSQYEGDVEMDFGADALVEYQAYHIAQNNPFKKLKYVNPYYQGWIYDCSKALAEKRYMRKYISNVFYRSAVTSWDNSARNSKGVICDGLSPDTFKEWMKDIMYESKNVHDMDNDFVFANSWNEWAEGSHLEPDMRYGYAYLQSLREAIEECRN